MARQDKQYPQQLPKGAFEMGNQDCCIGWALPRELQELRFGKDKSELTAEQLKKMNQNCANRIRQGDSCQGGWVPASGES